MPFSAEQSSPATCVTESCLICDEEFSSDGELTNHLVDHVDDPEFACLTDSGSSNDPSTPHRVFPEYTKTSFFKALPVRRNLNNVNKRAASPEVWEIVSDDSEEESKTPSSQKKASFRLVKSPDPKPSVQPPPKNNGPMKSGPPFTCHICSVKCGDMNTFKEHVLSHDRPKPYTCDICNKTFAYKGTLRQHLHLHIGEKLHQCKVCRKRFTLKSVLRKHEESHETQVQTNASKKQ